MLSPFERIYTRERLMPTVVMPALDASSGAGAERGNYRDRSA